MALQYIQGCLQYCGTGLCGGAVYAGLSAAEVSAVHVYISRLQAGEPVPGPGRSDHAGDT